MDATVASTGEKVVMIEAGAKEVPDDIMYEGIKAGPRGPTRPSSPSSTRWSSEIGKPKFDL